MPHTYNFIGNAKDSTSSWPWAKVYFKRKVNANTAKISKMVNITVFFYCEITVAHIFVGMLLKCNNRVDVRGHEYFFGPTQNSFYSSTHEF